MASCVLFERSSLNGNITIRIRELSMLEQALAPSYGFDERSTFRHRIDR
jgi:hypothetical protein